VKPTETDASYQMKKHLIGIIVLVICFAVGCFAIPTAELYRGKAEAYRDISRGVYKGKRSAHACIAVEPTKEYERVLLEQARFKIETTEDSPIRNQRYNEVQFARLERIYPGVVDRAFAQAIEWDHQHRLRTVKD
jgi:hypothetical protein